MKLPRWVMISLVIFCVLVVLAFAGAGWLTYEYIEGIEAAVQFEQELRESGK